MFSRHVRNSWKEERITPSLILEVLSYTSQFTRMQSVLRYPLVGMVEKKNVLRYRQQLIVWNEEGLQKHVSFNVLYTKETLFNITYVHSMEHRAVRLLSRHYDLTATGYKYLEIGINVGPPSYVEIALGDHHGYELSLSLEIWKGLYEQQWNIYKMLRNEYKDNFMSIKPLIVSVCTLNDATLVRPDSSSIRITTETTLRCMFEFDGCIDVTFERLTRLVDTVDKYTRFSNIASENAIRDSDIFNGHQLVDCELLALAFNTKKKETMYNI